MNIVQKLKSSKSGFTLLELIIVIIIIGVLASLALPQFTKAVERTQAGKAVNALTIIRKGEYLFRAQNNTYDAQATAALLNAATSIGDFVELDDLVADGDWTYGVAAVADITLDFLATATRSVGPNAAETITMDNTGAVSYAGWTP